MANNPRGLPPFGTQTGALGSFLQRLKSVVEEGLYGNKRWVRVEDLANGSLAETVVAGLEGTPGIGMDIDTTPPPAPTGVSVSGGLGTIHVTWESPSYGAEWSSHSHAVIRRGLTNIYADAAVIGQAPGGYFPDPVGDDRSNFYYWVTFVSRAAVEGAPSTTVGPVQAAADPSYLVESLSSADPDAIMFEVPAGGTVINGVNVPEGIYMKAAYIPYGVINQLHFDRATGNAIVVDDATFGTVLADSLKVVNANIVGEIKSDNYVAGAAGWRITKDGIAELSDAVVRGTVYAEGGWFKGTLQLGLATSMTDGEGLYAGDNGLGQWELRLGTPNGTRLMWLTNGLFVQSPKFSLDPDAGTATFAGDVTAGGRIMQGAMDGWDWPTGAGVGAYLGPEGVRLGNGNDPAVGSLEFDYATKLLKLFGNLQVRGDVEATSLKADSAEIVQTLHLAGNSVSVMNAATGTATTVATTLSCPAGQYMKIVAIGFQNGYHINNVSPSTFNVSVNINGNSKGFVGIILPYYDGTFDHWYWQAMCVVHVLTVYGTGAPITVSFTGFDNVPSGPKPQRSIAALGVMK